MSFGGYRTTEDLPAIMPVFPLQGVLLLPTATLPLNIFEPRYLNMIDDAMAGDRLIGMVQTRGGERERPLLAPVGCAGRITAYAETSDGRYMITLTGICRFRLGEELPSRFPYRQVRADFEIYANDLEEQDLEDATDRAPFFLALKHYLESRGLDLDWKSAEAAPADALVNSLAMGLPFDPAEKQALLEAATARDRREALIALMEIDAAEGDDDDGPPSVQ